MWGCVCERDRQAETEREAERQIRRDEDPEPRVSCWVTYPPPSSFPGTSHPVPTENGAAGPLGKRVQNACSPAALSPFPFQQAWGTGSSAF